jgi:hypothetical protein
VAFGAANHAHHTKAKCPVNSLDGIRILDLSRVLAGPGASRPWADPGADVTEGSFFVCRNEFQKLDARIREV